MTKKKHIWYISKYFNPKMGGSLGGRDFLLMREFVNQNIGVTVITSDSNVLSNTPSFEGMVFKKNIDGVDIIWLKTLKYTVAKSIKRILSWIHFEWNLFFLAKKNLPKPNAIIVSSLSLLTILNGIYLKKKYKCKLIFEIRDIWPLTLTEEGGFSLKNPLVRILGWIEKLGYKKSDLIIGTMPNLGEHVKKVLGYNKQTECIPMGITSIGEYDSQHINEIPNINIPKDKFIILYAGTIGITNALEVFFETIQSLQNNKNIHFVILGDGPLKTDFETKYQHCNNLTFIPKVDKTQVQSILQQADLLYLSVFPSKVWDYGQSLNKVVDYMLSGKPILASYSGYPSMINEAECGFFIPAGNKEALESKVLEIIQMDKNQLSEMGLRGKRWLLNNRQYPDLAKQYINFIFDGIE